MAKKEGGETATEKPAKQKKPVFHESARLMEFHQVPESERMSGIRLVFDMPDKDLKICDDADTTKRLRYGTLKIDYAPDPDHMECIELKGKLDRVATFPQSEKEAGYWKVTFRPSECDQDTALKLIRIRNGETPISLSFTGSYEQKEIFPDEKQEGDKAGANLDA